MNPAEMATWPKWKVEYNNGLMNTSFVIAKDYKAAKAEGLALYRKNAFDTESVDFKPLDNVVKSVTLVEE